MVLILQVRKLMLREKHLAQSQKKQREQLKSHSFCTWCLCTCCFLYLKCLSLSFSLGRLSPGSLSVRIISLRKLFLSSSSLEGIYPKFVLSSPELLEGKDCTGLAHAIQAFSIGLGHRGAQHLFAE